jgi:AmmeMemoRadiSam system protein B
MNKHFVISLALAYFILSGLFLHPHEAQGEENGPDDVRPSILAGTWYPGNPDELSKAVQGYLSRVKMTSLDGTLKALIVPHAGYVYSGPVAAHAYRLLQKTPFRRVILVGPSHRVGFAGVSVNLQSGYETPLGIVPVDQKLAKKILNASPNIRWLRKVHSGEHSLEIQLPFLQTVLQNFTIVPLIMGQQDPDTCSNLSKAIAQVLADAEDTLLIASSDLSHFHTYNQAKALDQIFIDHVRMFDPQGLSKDLLLGKCEACGGGPVITILLAARDLGVDKTSILNYANSGDVTGNHRSVVGYLSAAALRSSDTGPRPKQD